MHCSLAFGSIGARAKLIGMASHHHAAAIAPRDMMRSARGVRSEIVRPSNLEIVGEPAYCRDPTATEIIVRRYLLDCESCRQIVRAASGESTSNDGLKATAGRLKIIFAISRDGLRGPAASRIRRNPEVTSEGKPARSARR